MKPHAAPVYLDNNATTRTDPRVVEAMLPYFSETYGNAASRTHAFGWVAEEAVDKARAQIAGAIGADAREIVFTSGATESDNLALKGAAEALTAHGDHIVTVSTEHNAILDVCRRLEKQGKRVTYLPVGPDGLLDVDRLADAIEEQTILVSVMAANNEIGVLQPLSRIGALCRERGVLFHTDAVQAFGKIALNVEAMHIDLLSLSAHKIYGPKGVGALYVRRRHPRVRLIAQMDGGGHERGFRSGTLNVPGIVGFGAAATLAIEEMPAESLRLQALRDRLYGFVSLNLKGVRLNGHPTERLPGNLNLSFEGIEGESLILALRDVALSTGSACTSASLAPSHVLRALGMDDETAYGSLRFGIGRFNTEEEIDYVARRVVEEVNRLRALMGAPA